MQICTTSPKPTNGNICFSLVDKNDGHNLLKEGLKWRQHKFKQKNLVNYENCKENMKTAKMKIVQWKMAIKTYYIPKTGKLNVSKRNGAKKL